MKALNLSRGFRRMCTVASVAWLVGSGFYIWQKPAPEPLSQSKGRVDIEKVLADPRFQALTSEHKDAVLRELGYAFRTRPGVTPDPERPWDSDPVLEEIAPPAPSAPPTPRLRTWLEVALVPALLAWVVLESLLWAARGFLPTSSVGKTAG